MKKSILTITLTFFVLVFLTPSINFSQTYPNLEEVKDLYPKTSEDYKGMVACNIGDGDDHDELIVDFGSNGLWIHNAAAYTSWAQISGNDPDYIIAAKLAGIDYEIVADFGSLGLWHWNYTTFPGLWTKISNGNAQSILAVDDDWDGYDEIYADFGTSGTWRWDWTDGWTKVSNGNPSASFKSDFWTIGYEEAAFDYGSSGIWIVYFDNITPGVYYWDRLNKSDVDDDIASADLGITGGSAEDFVVDFGSSGLWIKESDWGSWGRINKHSAYDIKRVRNEGASDYELLVMFDVGGLWWWNWNGSYPGEWVQISHNRPEHDGWGGGFCEPFDPNGKTEANNDEEVAVDFGSNGLWLWDWTTDNWTKLHTWDPKHMLRADYYNDGKDVTLIVDFEAYGLYMYDGYMDAWAKLHDLSPDN